MCIGTCAERLSVAVLFFMNIHPVCICDKQPAVINITQFPRAFSSSRFQGPQQCAPDKPDNRLLFRRRQSHSRHLFSSKLCSRGYAHLLSSCACGLPRKRPFHLRTSAAFAPVVLLRVLWLCGMAAGFAAHDWSAAAAVQAPPTSSLVASLLLTGPQHFAPVVLLRSLSLRSHGCRVIGSSAAVAARASWVG